MNLAWAPQPGPQTEAITADWCNELCYGGAAGGGKSDFLLGDFLQDVPTYGAAWQGILFRRTYPELEELVRRSFDLYPQTGASWLEQKHSWIWSNGAILRMRYLERDADASRYQGHQYTWQGWDELTQWPSDYSYRYLRGRLRSANPVPTMRIRAATNPGGPGHHWVKAYFIDPEPRGFKTLTDDVTGMTRMFVPARLQDNVILLHADPAYGDRLKGLGSPQLVKAWLEGDWNVIEGSFFPEFGARHVIAPFVIPGHWYRFRSGDWGSARPFSIGWWAVVSDDFEISGAGLPENISRLPRGALVRYREWYGASSPNVGLKLTAEQVAEGIKEREAGDPPGMQGVMDPAAFSSDGGPSIAERMADHGIYWRKADNARVARSGAMGGWDQLRARLVGQAGQPMLYVFSTCRDLIRTLPALQHDRDRPEDVDTDAEDHAADECRYACMSRPYIREAQAAKPPPDSGYRARRDDASDSVLTI